MSFIHLRMDFIFRMEAVHSEDFKNAQGRENKGSLRQVWDNNGCGDGLIAERWPFRP
jgi:hypothetical protein